MNEPQPPSLPSGARVLVLGATSLIGGYLLPMLGAAGLEAVALTRGGAPPGPGVAGVEWRRGDLADARLAETVGPVATVLSLSPIWLLPQALPALARLGARRVVAVSSTSRLIKIASPIAAERAVAERLAMGEAETQRLCDGVQIAWTILRPTLIYAEGRDGNVSRLASLIRRWGVLPLSGAGAGLRQPVHAADLAGAALEVVGNPATFGRIYDLPGGETLTYRVMAERVFEGLDRRPRILSLPPWAWRIGLALASPLLPGATAGMGLRMAEDLAFDSAPAARDFGWAPRPFHPRFR